MKRVNYIIQGLLSVAFILSGGMKLIGGAEQLQPMAEGFGYSVEFMYFIAVCEILGGLGLIVAFWKPNLSIIASGGLVILMAGAVFSHLSAEQGIGAAMPSLILLLLGLVLLIGRGKSMMESIKNSPSS
ncbi:DoxX family protein [Bacillus spongiae]|uniref:DoxX family protein n=1 Tax=Bacillus spongiae TaxID=2683610 RepID=A0ABU8HFT3_9BACI